MTTDVLIVVSIGLGATLALCVIAIFGDAAWTEVRTVVQTRRIQNGRAATIQALDETTHAAEIPTAVSLLPFRLQVDLLADIAELLSGEARDVLIRFAGDIGAIAHAERRCRSRLWWRRLQGARLLTSLRAPSPSMTTLFDDPHPELRAQAAEWAADHPTHANISRLLMMLDDEQALCRFTVKESLLRMGQAVIEPLARFIQHRSGVALEDAMEVAAALGGPAFLPAGLQFANSSSPRIRAAAARLLGSIGGEEAAVTLTTLLRDEDQDVRAEAAQSLGRLHHFSAEVADLLRDPSWRARRAAAMALRSLGGVGMLYLRRALSDDDRYARDMAQQVLDFPREVEAG